MCSLIAISCRRTIILHIRSYTTTKGARDTLAELYAGHNEARVAFCERLDMQEDDSIDEFLTHVKEFWEQPLNIDEVLRDGYFVQTYLRNLPDSYQTFGTTMWLLAGITPDTITFANLVSLLLNEEQSSNRNNLVS